MCAFRIVCRLAIVALAAQDGIGAPKAEVTLELSKPQIMPEQNQQITVRVRNLGPGVLRLQGFTLGYVLPEIQIRSGTGPWARIIRGNQSESDRSSRPIVLAAGEERVWRTMMLDRGMWSEALGQPGDYELRPTLPGILAHEIDTDKYVHVEWQANVVPLRILKPDEKTKKALARLKEWGTYLKAQTGTYEERRVRFLRSFVADYGDTAYADEARWELVQRLHNSLGTGRIPANERGATANEMVQLCEALAQSDKYHARQALRKLAGLRATVDEVRDLRAAHHALEEYLKIAPGDAEAEQARRELRAILDEGGRTTRPSEPPHSGADGSARPTTRAGHDDGVLIVLPSTRPTTRPAEEATSRPADEHTVGATTRPAR